MSSGIGTENSTLDELARPSIGATDPLSGSAAAAFLLFLRVLMDMVEEEKKREREGGRVKEPHKDKHGND
jgi:hypothetical protein